MDYNNRVKANEQFCKFEMADGNYVGYHCEGCETFVLGGSVRLDNRPILDDRPLFLHSEPSMWKSDRLYRVLFTVAEDQVWATEDPNEYFSLFDPAVIIGRGMPATENLIELSSQGYRLFMFRDLKHGEDESLLFPASQIVSSVTLVT